MLIVTTGRVRWSHVSTPVKCFRTGYSWWIVLVHIAFKPGRDTISDMRVPFMDIHAEYMDTRHRRVLDLRRDGLAEVPMLGWYRYEWARPDLPAHRHAGGFEICYLERGKQIFEVQQRPYRLSGGEVFLTFPDELHSTGGNPSEPGILHWINVRLPRPGRGLLGLPRKESDTLVKGLLGLAHRHFRATDETGALFKELFSLHDSAEIFQRATRMRCAAIRLLFEVIDGSRQHCVSATSRRMEQIIRWIRGHPGANHGLEDLARRAQLSVSHFKRRFRAETGVSPWQFILQHKIEAARDRLSASDASVTRIAFDLGFSSSQYFATVFKRLTGVTATAYRRGMYSHGPSRRRDDGQA